MLKELEIPDVVLPLQNLDQVKGYLAAMIDGEGHVTRTVTSTGKRVAGQLIITNTDDDIVAATKGCLDRLGIHYTFVPRTLQEVHHKPGWTIRLGRISMLYRVLLEIPVQSTRKRINLVAHIQKSIQLKPRPTAAQLRDLYLSQRRSTTEIAAATKFTPRAINNWLRLYDIPIRSTREARALSEQKRLVTYMKTRHAKP